MSGFPKGLRVLLVDGFERDGLQAALRNPELGYSVTAVASLEAAVACFAGGAAAFDCVLLEHALIETSVAATAVADSTGIGGSDGSGSGRNLVEELFEQARVGQAPVVLMAEAPSQEAVLAGVHLGAADFLERPLSFHKLKTLWQHKIRRMMQSANGGMLPRPPSCPQLPLASMDTAGAGPTMLKPLHRCISVPGLSTAQMQAQTQPSTPSPHASSCGVVPQDSASLGSGSSSQQPTHRLAAASTAAAAAAGTAAAADAHRSDATSSGPRMPAVQQPATFAGPASAPPSTIAQLPAPLAHLQNAGAALAPGCEPPAVQWPLLPSGTVWGTPVGCGIAPPLPGSAKAPAAAQPAPASIAAPAAEQLPIRWCPPMSLPVAASSSELLLPEGFSLSLPATSGTANSGRGPLGLRLNITPDLLADLNATLAPAGQQPAAQMAAASPTTAALPLPGTQGVAKV